MFLIFLNILSEQSLSTKSYAYEEKNNIFMTMEGAFDGYFHEFSGKTYTRRYKMDCQSHQNHKTKMKMNF